MNQPPMKPATREDGRQRMQEIREKLQALLERVTHVMARL
jgi:hypothetical protein